MIQYARETVEKFEPGKSTEWEANPCTTAFCRTRFWGNVMLTGGLIAVEKRVKGIGPALVSWQMWKNGKSRGYVTLENCPGYVLHGNYGKKEGDRKTLVLRQLTIFIKYGQPNEKGSIELARWRRVPSTFPNVLKGKVG